METLTAYLSQETLRRTHRPCLRSGFSLVLDLKHANGCVVYFVVLGSHKTNFYKLGAGFEKFSR